MLEVYNTLTRKKEVFNPLEEGKVKLYCCGPTVYNFAHIGNLRTYVFEDFFRRTLEYLGYKVHHVMNITDIDDKTIRGANQEGKTLGQYTQKYTKAFFEDLKQLNVLPAHDSPKATDFVDSMIEMIAKLIADGTAYTDNEGNVFFKIEKFSDYGKLSHLNLKDLQAGASKRVANDEYEKGNVSDFVLWKGYDKQRDGQVFYQAPWSKGRPGWHIECSAMSKAILGDRIDIHMGGVDNIFPHHENEIAQSECCSNKKFVNYWVHVEHLLVDNKKMSKSLGNFYTLRDLLGKGYTGRQVRFALLNAHYKTQLNFTFDGLVAAKSSLKRIDECVDQIRRVKSETSQSNIDLDFFVKEFNRSLKDDLNAPQAFSVVFNMINHLNDDLQKQALSIYDAKKVLDVLEKFDAVLGFLDVDREQMQIPKELEEALQARQAARESKDFKTADAMRTMIHDAGYQIVDTKEGAFLKLI